MRTLDFTDSLVRQVFIVVEDLDGNRFVGCDVSRQRPLECLQQIRLFFFITFLINFLPSSLISMRYICIFTVARSIYRPTIFQ